MIQEKANALKNILLRFGGDQREFGYSSSVLYRILRTVNAWFPIAVLWICIGAFFVALPFMFLFPQVTLVLLFAGLGGIGVAVMGWRVLQAIQKRLARQSMARGVCPNCRAPVVWDFASQTEVRCMHCNSAYTQDGVELEDQPQIHSGQGEEQPTA